MKLKKLKIKNFLEKSNTEYIFLLQLIIYYKEFKNSM
jgi:hypothetical protein